MSKYLAEEANFDEAIIDYLKNRQKEFFAFSTLKSVKSFYREAKRLC